MRLLTASAGALSFLAAIATASVLPSTSHGDHGHAKRPGTVVVDGGRLVSAKTRLRRGEHKYVVAMEHLKAQADSWLGQGPWTVTNKDTAPPNGTLHDYASQAPYWWPNPDTEDGCPYIQRDGERNPDVDKYQDRVSVGKMFNSTYVLSLAWWYTGQAKYSKHAADIVRTWFLDEDTAMNPNLNHAQIIPCANDGRAIGIIDFSQEYTNVVDAVAILSTGAPGWTAADTAAFRRWNARFLEWLTESDFGKEEAGETNNHGTFANMQISALALYVGDKRLAADTAELAKSFIDNQITSNGSQPEELERTRSWHYSNFNLGAHLRWALVAEKVGVDLFGYRGPEGQSLFKAVNMIVPAAVGGEKDWHYEELDFFPFAGTDNVQGAADAGLCQAKKAVRKGLPPPPGGDIFVLRPAPQQLDNIATS